MSVFSENLAGGGFGAFGAYEPDLAGADAVILPVPYDATVCYQPGTRNGPQAIINSAPQVEHYDFDSGFNCEDLKLTLLNEIETDVSGPEAMMARIEKVYKAVAKKVPFILMLGGEHSIPHPAVRVMAEKHKGSLSVVQFDAHADLRDSYMGSPHSHASVMRRVIDFAPITQIGIRNVSKEEAEFIKTSGHPVYYAQDITGKTNWIDDMVKGLNENVYISVDLDGFDPSVIPGVGTPEPGGLLWRDVTEAIKRIGEKRNIVGADVVELKPLPGSVQSEFTAAKLCFKILSTAFLIR